MSALLHKHRLPFIDARGRSVLKERLAACAPDVSKSFGIPLERLAAMKELGCGNYGCTFLLPGYARDKSVLKVTTDNLEANAAHYLSREGNYPEGVVRVWKVAQLGKCSVLKHMRPFVYKVPEDWDNPRRDNRQPTTLYRGPGAPYRPAWVLWREELEDAWPKLQKRGVKQLALKRALDALFRYIMDYAINTSFVRRKSMFAAPERRTVYEELRPVQGERLLEACEWFVENDMVYLDFRKLVNLGWRDGTGLVIRDVGFTEAGTDNLEDIPRAGEARGRMRPGKKK